MPSDGSSSLVFRRAFAGLSPRQLKTFLNSLQGEVARRRPFCCLITGDAEIRRLNHRFRGKDATTDVLSFPSAAAGHLGDIAISAPRARTQARRYGHSVQDEVKVLMLHGVLHLTGMDHENDQGRMALAERRWRKRLGLPAALIERTSA